MRYDSVRLDWLKKDQWVKLIGAVVKQGVKWNQRDHIDGGVVQAPIKQVYENTPFAIWHKPGRKVWASQLHTEYEPAALILVQNTGETIDGYYRYKTLRIIETGRYYQRVLSELKQSKA